MDFLNLTVFTVGNSEHSGISNMNKVQTSDTETFYGKDALVYGWGYKSLGVFSDVLMEVSVSVDM